MATVKVIKLEDGFKLTHIDCDCGQTFVISHKNTTFSHCFNCSRKYLNIAYFYINEDGILSRRTPDK